MELEQLRKQLRRPASRMILGGFRPSAALSVSWFGRVRLARQDEHWPMHAGEPMVPLCQINCRELPYLPSVLEDVALLTVFISGVELPLDSPNGDGWELRAYPSTEGLVELAAPNVEEVIRPLPVRWELIEDDYPSWDDIDFELPQEVDDNYFDLFENKDGSKVGGWPSLIQGRIFWAPWNQHPASPEYVFQIDSEEKANWMWGDSGVGYFGRGTADASNIWTFDWQCF